MMTSTLLQEQFESQPVFVMNDIAYDRMYKKLTDGSTGEWSYINICPHRSSAACDCPKYLNILKDGVMKKLIKGEWKQTIPLREMPS